MVKSLNLQKVHIPDRFRDGLKFRTNAVIRQYSSDGRLIKEEMVHNLVTDVGCAHIADQLSDQGEAQMGWMAIGTGVAAPAAGDTTLGTEIDRVALDSLTQGAGAADHTVIYVATFTGNAAAVTEAGILNAASNGTLLNRLTFGPFTVTSGDTLVFTITLTIADDGV